MTDNILATVFPATQSSAVSSAPNQTEGGSVTGGNTGPFSPSPSEDTRGTGLPVLALSSNPTITPTASQPGQLGTFEGNVYIHYSAIADTKWALVGGGELSVLVLLSDPTVTPTVGQPGQLGTFGGNVYVHYSSVADTKWVLLGGSGLPVLTLSTDPTATPVSAAQGQMGTFSGGLYLHYGPGTDVAWILIQSVSNLINNAIPVITLSSDPTITATASKVSQCGTFGGNLYIHLTASTDTNWRNLGTIGAGLPVLTLPADPTLTAAAGKPGQLGTFGGNAYIHFSSASDTSWKILGGGGLPVLTLAADPTATPTNAAQGQMGTFSGNLYVHLTASTDTNWRNLGTIGAGLPVLTLPADPTLTAAAGQPGQLGTFGGNAYIHVSSVSDTNWKILGGGGLPVLTLSTDPTATPVNGAQGQMGTYSGGLYLHYGLGTDVAWILIQSVSNLINNAIPVITLSNDPTITATASKISQCGTFGGNLYVHLTASTDTNWLNLSSTLPVAPTAVTYNPSSGAQTVTLLCQNKNLHIVNGNASGTSITLSISGDTNNQPFMVSITQGATLSILVAWFGTIRWAGGTPPTLTATATKRDWFGFIRTGAGTYDGFVVGQNC